jgi:hypothetical protein
MRKQKTVALSSVKSILKATFPLVETVADKKLYFKYDCIKLSGSLANYDRKVFH